MAQERFADVVERFTSGFNGAAAAVSPEVAKQWQEEAQSQRPAHEATGARWSMNPGAEDRTDAPAGNLPAQQVAALAVRVEPHDRTPMLFVPNLGISRPYIFDLLPKGSFVEHMTRRASTSISSTGACSVPEDNDLTSRTA